jgi:chromosomal replication initiator protein
MTNNRRSFFKNIVTGAISIPFLSNIQLGKANAQINSTTKKTRSNQNTSKKSLNTRESDVDFQASDRYSFDNFVVGECNSMAHTVAINVATLPVQSYNPVYIHGGVGVGKTHLLHAIASQILAIDSSKTIRLISSENFMTLFVDSIRNATSAKFKEQFRSVDILLVDDIQFFAGKTGTQVEFFHTFNALYGANKQIVLTSDSLPSEVEFLEERLQSRFAQGLVVELYQPNLETRVAILKQKALEEKVELNEDTAHFLANNIQSNVRELEGALHRVTLLARLKKVPISNELIRDSGMFKM